MAHVGIDAAGGAPLVGGGAGRESAGRGSRQNSGMSVDYPPPRVPHMVQFREPVDPGATFVDLRGSYDLRPPIDALRIRGYGGAQGNIACSGSSHSKSTLQALFSSPMHVETLDAIARTHRFWPIARGGRR